MRVTRVLLVVCGIALAACESRQDIEFQEPNAMKPGPGLFSGEDGVFTIFSGGGSGPDEGEDNGD